MALDYAKHAKDFRPSTIIYLGIIAMFLIHEWKDPDNNFVPFTIKVLILLVILFMISIFFKNYYFEGSRNGRTKRTIKVIGRYFWGIGISLVAASVVLIPDKIDPLQILLAALFILLFGVALEGYE